MGDDDKSCLDPSKSSFRYVLLICNCLLTFGSYYCFDMPTVLENVIEEQVIATFTDSVSTYYNLFYTIYAWTNMCMSLVAGVVIDKYGTRFSSFLFLTLCLVGASLFALGASLVHIPGKTRYIIMFVGRFIFGLGGGSITIVQNAITAKWFKGRELAFAFGCTLTISRIGSVVNYDATSLVYDAADETHPGFGLGITLWIGSGLVAMSYLANAGIIYLENKKQRYDSLMMNAGVDDEGKADSKASEKQSNFWDDLKKLPVTFWLVCLIITFFYNLVFPWQAIAVDYIRTSYGNHPNEWASWRASMVYMVSMVVSPFLGAAVDWYGRRDWLTIAGTGLSIPVFIMLGNSHIEPVVPLLLLGVAYSVCAAALWPTLQILVDSKVVGRANGIATSMQMLGIGICNIIVGQLKDTNKEANPNAANCCSEEGNSTACFSDDDVCAASKYGGCSAVSIDGIDFANSCQGTNYKPMLIFFTSMAAVALLLAIALKFIDRTDYALYLGIRDKKIAFRERYGREPETPEEMTEATLLAKMEMKGETFTDSTREPLISEVTFD